ncbi:MAG: 50S ribosomal protein L2 [Candidatus Micrarchaeia archaeon]
MGKRLKQQRRGKGSNVYRKPANHFKADVLFKNHNSQNKVVGEVVEFIDDPGHTAPLMKILYEDYTTSTLIAPEGIKIGDKIEEGNNASLTLGSVLKLKEIPDGMPIYNIESFPGDGGKLTRAAGTFATVVAHNSNSVTVSMPSKQNVDFSPECRAEIGAVAGGGAKAKPIMKAGKNFYIKHAVNRTWPTNRGVKSNPVDHPFGGKQHHKGASSMTSRNAPPGAKVGHIAARRVGRKKRG